MEKEVLEKYKKAGEICKEAKELARKELKVGTKVLDLAEKIESFIKKKGVKPAFPVNISINDIAAHYSPDIDDETVIKEGDLVKIDIGVHVDGYIADSAFSVCVGEKSHVLITAAEETLKEVLKAIKPEVTVEELSTIIEEVVSSFDVNPIRNLAGHSLERYIQHGGLSIPNGKVPIKQKIKEGTAIGMEVFTTTGEGWVKESSPTLIYRFLRPVPVRLRTSRLIMGFIVDNFQTLPFAKRWLRKIGPKASLELALRELVSKGAISEYPPLREKSGKPVAQAEETVIVLDKPVITTI